MEIGKRLKDMRTGMGMTQEECAEKLGVARQTLSSWESGRTFPDIRSVVAISDLFGVSLDALLKEDAAAVDRLEDAADEAFALEPDAEYCDGNCAECEEECEDREEN